MDSRATFTNVSDLADFCAGLAKAGVNFNVVPGIGSGAYVVHIGG